MKKLYDKYYLDSDDRNFILKKKIVTKYNRTAYRIVGYYTNMKKLIKKLKETYVFDNLTIQDYDFTISKLKEIDRLL